ncbi:hypothetical protein PSAC2689_110027 [Paraburkholderia sacchari]
MACKRTTGGPPSLLRKIRGQQQRAAIHLMLWLPACLGVFQYFFLCVTWFTINLSSIPS